MSSTSSGNGTTIGINLDQDFDIDYTNERRSHETEYETTHTHNHNYNTNISHDYETTHTKGLKLALELETEQTKTENYNKNVDVDIDESYTSDTFVLDIHKDVSETIRFVQNETWDVTVNVTSENIVQDSHVHSDEDINDIDLARLINVAGGAQIDMEDFSADIRSIGDSFNGGGNDGHINVNQSNNLVDNDNVHGTGTSYSNHQLPNVHGHLSASAYYAESSHAGGSANYGYGGDFDSHTKYFYGYPVYNNTTGHHYGQGSASAYYGAAAAAGGTLAVDLHLSAPTDAFETVVAEGGNSTAGDGIDHAHLSDTNNDNEGDGIVSGITSASADASAAAAAFNNEIMAGGNQQANFSTVNLIGGSQLDAGDGYALPGGASGDASDTPDGDGGLAIRNSHAHLDNDLNDIDAIELINVSGVLAMEDFDLDVDAIASSFNGPGNDWAFDVNQSNDLVDNDTVTGTYATYVGGGWNAPLQSVTATGGYAGAGDGIGSIGAYGVANSNGGDGAILGSSAATADAIASASAFSNSIVVGANLQVNNFSATIVGGDSALLNDL